MLTLPPAFLKLLWDHVTAMAQNTCWSAVHFVDTLLRDFSCPICLEVLQDPFLTECCGHHFCNVCIRSVLQHSSECPACKAQPVYGIVDKRFKRELDDARVYCSMRSQGCEWTGPLSELTAHLSYGQLNGPCQFVTVSCSRKNCSHTSTRHKMKKHIKSACKHRPFTCPYCKYSGVYVEVTSSHYQSCPQFPVMCPNNCAPHKIKRSELKGHFKVCPNVGVRCPFSGVGCGVTMKRGDQESHVESHVVLHQALIASAVTELHETVNKIDTKCEYSFTQVHSKISSLERKYVELQDELSVLTKGQHKVRSEAIPKKIEHDSCSHCQCWVTGYKAMAAAMKKNNWRLYLTTMAETVTQYPEPVCPVVLRIIGYQQSVQEELCSPQFRYTNDKGDKYTLQLICRNTDNGMTLLLRDTSHQSSSPAFSLPVAMLNQLEDKSHIIKEIDFESRLIISCMELKKPDMSFSYIRNSTVFFEVTKPDEQ